MGVLALYVEKVEEEQEIDMENEEDDIRLGEDEVERAERKSARSLTVTSADW